MFPFRSGVINIPPELQRKLNAIRDLDERVESLKSELAGKRDQCLKMEPHCSRNATPEQVAEAVKARDDMSAKQKVSLLPFHPWLAVGSSLADGSDVSERSSRCTWRQRK